MLIFLNWFLINICSLAKINMHVRKSAVSFAVFIYFQVRRSYVSCAVMEGYLYAVGGWNENDGSLNSVERYNLNGAVKVSYILLL